jgi:hypothetical protein
MFFFISRMSCHGVKTVPEYIRIMKEFSVEGICKNKKLPAFISAGEFDKTAVAQATELYENIDSKDKILIIFKGEDGAGEHCEFANQDIFYSTVFNWLDERIK